MNDALFVDLLEGLDDPDGRLEKFLGVGRALQGLLAPVFEHQHGPVSDHAQLERPRGAGAVELLEHLVFVAETGELLGAGMLGAGGLQNRVRLGPPNDSAGGLMERFG